MKNPALFWSFFRWRTWPTFGWPLLLLLLLVGLLLNLLTTPCWYSDLHRYTKPFFSIAVILLVADRLRDVLTRRGASPTGSEPAGPVEPPGEPASPRVSPPPPAGVLPKEAPGSSGGFCSELSKAYEEAMRTLGELEQAWLEDQKRQRSSETGSEAQTRIAELSGLTDQLVSALESMGESALSILNLRKLAERLRSAGSEPEGEARGSVQFPVLQPPEEWLATHPGGDEGYRRYLTTSVRKAEIEARKKPESPRERFDWRSFAESLLQIVGTRRPAAGEEDLYELRDLHERLLQILGYKEIPLAVGNPIDREIHTIETTRPTAELRPNLVLKVIAPGYLDGEGKVWRKATVVMSEQFLG